jgi:HSP20 family molecular chaperone IbpA
MTNTPATTPATTSTVAPESARNVPLWRPIADVMETRDGLVVMLEMPGVAAEDVEVTLERRVLTVRGRTRITRPEALRAVHLEYEPGDYERAFLLPEDFDATRVEATMRHGVLTLTLPRAEEAQPRNIRVKAA